MPVGATLGEREVRPATVVRLLGGIELASTDGVATQEQLHGQQPRVLFAALALAQPSGLEHEQLALMIWGTHRPRTWRAALRGVALRVRRVVETAAADAEVASSGGGYRLVLPGPVVVDHREMKRRVAAAERAARSGRTDEAVDLAADALCHDRGPFLPACHGRWVERRRAEADSAARRALHVLARAHEVRGELERAVRTAEEAVERSPHDEGTRRLVMELYAAGGDTAQAVRVYNEWREDLAEELGVAPSPRTERLYVQLLRRRA